MLILDIDGSEVIKFRLGIDYTNRMNSTPRSKATWSTYEDR